VSAGDLGRTAAAADDVYRDRLYENQGLPALIDLVDPRQSRVLDVGCGAGANMRLLAARGHEVVGETLSDAEAELVRKAGFACLVRDISGGEMGFPAESFDALVFSHVLEHLAFPEAVLRRYVTLLKRGGGVYVAVPNALRLAERLDFVRGRFRYTETGIMDRTHLRFFDFRSARHLVEQDNLEVLRHFGVGHFPMGPFRKAAPGLCRRVDRWVCRWWPGIFAFHIIVTARKLT
jgi:2-polyprenyl-3-methyl-5-hydroxy-6-metoxy-1,4-benzoquinol methylase